MSGRRTLAEELARVTEENGTLELILVYDAKKGWYLDPPFVRSVNGAKHVADALRMLADKIEANPAETGCAHRSTEHATVVRCIVCDEILGEAPTCRPM